MSFQTFSLFLLSVRNALGVPTTRVPIDTGTFVSYVLPSLVCYLVMAVLAVTPQTRTIRVALWPLVSSLALRTALSMDMSRGRTELKSLNIGFVHFFLTIAARTFGWALAKEPLMRHLRPANSSPSILMDALDLASNARGIGWDWSNYRSYIPHETRPTNRVAFIVYTSLSAVVHTLICGACHRAVLTMAPVGVGSNLGGSTIFDETLPFSLRYLRATILSTISAFMIYSSVQMTYDITTVLAILVLVQDPAQWPPLFNAPWRATSLSDFWGQRWHQWWRHTFLRMGGYPLSLVLGRPGVVIGSFLASAVLHHIGLVVLNDKIEFCWTLVGFGMMGPGVLIERAFYKLTGRRVGGVLGWVWTMVWLILCGNVMVEGFARAGMFDCASFVDSGFPVRIPLEHLAADFDAWLHSV